MRSLCVHSPVRRQITEASFRKYGGDFIEVESAGLEPGVLNPFVVRALAEDGIDSRGKATRYVITVCSREAAERCPIFPRPSEKLHCHSPIPQRSRVRMRSGWSWCGPCGTPSGKRSAGSWTGGVPHRCRDRIVHPT